MPRKQTLLPHCFFHAQIVKENIHEKTDKKKYFRSEKRIFSLEYFLEKITISSFLPESFFPCAVVGPTLVIPWRWEDAREYADVLLLSIDPDPNNKVE